VLVVASSVFIQNLRVEHETFLVQFFLRSSEVKPTFDSKCVKVRGILFEHLLNNLTCTFQLVDVPKEGGSTKEVTITCLFFSFILL
jgi:hypothetical protein